MKTIIFRTAFLFAVILFVGFAYGVTAQSVTGSIAKGTVTRGTAARATVVLNIPGGLHVNSNRPTGEYAIPTTVNATAHGAKIGGISYPRGRDRKFSFSEHPINVYEGRAAFGFNVTVPAGYKGTTITVRVTVKYQACTNEVCYAPKSKAITLTAKVI